MELPDRIALRRLENGRIAARWYAAGALRAAGNLYGNYRARQPWDKTRLSCISYPMDGSPPWCSPRCSGHTASRCGWPPAFSQRLGRAGERVGVGATPAAWLRWPVLWCRNPKPEPGCTLHDRTSREDRAHTAATRIPTSVIILLLEAVVVLHRAGLKSVTDKSDTSAHGPDW